MNNGTLVIWGRQAESGDPVGVYTSISALPLANSTCPEGNSSMRQVYGGPLEFGGFATGFSEVPSNSKNCMGPGKLPPCPAGPATQSTLPLGSKHAGASLAPIKLPLLSTGKSGPVVQVPGWSAMAGGV